MEAVKNYVCCCLFSAPPAPPMVTFGSVKGLHTQVAKFCVTGTGIAFANTPLLQTRSYYEVKIVSTGSGGSRVRQLRVPCAVGVGAGAYALSFK